MSNTKRAFSLLTLAGLLAAGTLHAEGGDQKNGHKAGSANTAEILYLGKVEGRPVFDLVYNNAAGGRFSVTVLDNQGNQYFTGYYNDKFFDKKFTLADDLAYSGNLEFVVRNFADNSVQHFEINTGTRVVEDIQVKEVK